MSAKSPLTSAFHFLLLAALLSASGVFIALGYDATLRAFWQQQLLHHPEFFVKLGFATLLLSALLFLLFYWLNRGSYLHLKGGAERRASVDAALILALVERYYAEALPGSATALDVQVHRGGVIEVFSTFLHPTEELLARVERELEALFVRELHYEREFLLTVAAGTCSL